MNRFILVRYSLILKKKTKNKELKVGWKYLSHPTFNSCLSEASFTASICVLVNRILLFYIRKHRNLSF